MIEQRPTVHDLKLFGRSVEDLVSQTETTLKKLRANRIFIFARASKSLSQSLNEFENEARPRELKLSLNNGPK